MAPSSTQGGGLNYYRWGFRTKARCANKLGEHDIDIVSEIVGGFRGETSVVAREVGLGSLLDTDGVDTLTTAMREILSPLTTQEAKELFRQYTKPNGLLPRQRGESMKQYISRRNPLLEVAQGTRSSDRAL